MEQRIVQYVYTDDDVNSTTFVNLVLDRWFVLGTSGTDAFNTVLLGSLLIPHNSRRRGRLLTCPAHTGELFLQPEPRTRLAYEVVRYCELCPG